MTETPRPDPWTEVERWSVTGTYAERMRVKFAGSSIGEWMRSADVDAARAADAARHKQEIASLRAVMTTDVDRILEQAETIRQLQTTLPELHDAIERQSAQIAALTDGTAMQHARKQADADGFQRGWHAAVTRVAEGDSYRDLAWLVPIIDERVRDRLEAAEARCATLTAALEEISQMLDCPGGHRPAKPPCEACGHEVQPVWCAGCIARAALSAVKP